MPVHAPPLELKAGAVQVHSTYGKLLLLLPQISNRNWNHLRKYVLIP